MKPGRSKYLPALIIFAVAFLVRLIYFLQIRSSFPGWDTPILDMLYHDQWARRIAGGEWFGTAPFFRAPFYAYFVGTVYALAGPIYSVPILIQHVIGALSCSLIFAFTETWFDRRTALTAATVSVFYWVFVYFENELLLDSLLVPMSVALIWLLMRAAKRPARSTLFQAGLVLGLAVITRPNFLAFMPFIMIWMWLVYSKKTAPTIRRFSMLTLGTALVILPVALHNTLAGGEFVLVSSQGGVNFYIGNNSQTNGTSPIIPELGVDWTLQECEQLARDESGTTNREMTHTAVSSHFYGKAVRYITGHPLDWVKLTLKKTALFWNAHEIQNNRNLYFLRKYASITHILPPLFWLVSPLSLVGLLLIFRYKRNYHIIGMFVIVYMMTVVLFFVNARFRLPVLPFLIILSSIVFWRVIDWVREKNYGVLASYGVLMVFLFPLTNTTRFDVLQQNYSKSHYSLGISYLQKGLLAEASAEFDRAIQLNPGLPYVHFNKGLIHFRQGNADMAKREFERELAGNPDNVDAYSSLSVLARSDGRYSDALAHIRSALERAPRDPRACVQEILVLELMGRNDDAFSRAERLVSIDPDYPPGHYLLGRMLFQRGLYDRAERELQPLTELDLSPSGDQQALTDLYSRQEDKTIEPKRMAALAHYLLGMKRLREGRLDAAIACFEQSVDIAPENADAWSNLGLACDRSDKAMAAHDRAIQIQPENPILYFNRGMTLAKMEQYEKARENLNRALQLNPDFQMARDRLKMLESYIDGSQ